MVIVLAASAVLLRVKERLPAEGARREAEQDGDAAQREAEQSDGLGHERDGRRDDRSTRA